MQLTGIHHVTAVTANVRENHRFYTQVLGMRLVKRSVNQDDVRAYHLFYADGKGTPGTDLTFFDWNVPLERRGSHSISRTGLRVAGADSVEWWWARLADEGHAGEMLERDGRVALDFEDPEGQRLTLIADDTIATGGAADGGPGTEFEPWLGSTVPPQHQVRGLGPITMSVPDPAPTEPILTRVLGMRRAREYESGDGRSVHVYEMWGSGAAAELHVAVEPGLPVVRPGAGGVHHVAFRVPDDDTHRAWFERLDGLGIGNSGIVDRYYFRSLYFREPNGILFEIATDGPGFAVDEDPETLGEKVVLPPFLEARRENIVANLRPID